MKLKEIMLVDDNYIDNYIAKNIIEKENVAETITVLSSSLGALDYLKNKADGFPELIFLDIKMPIMDGFGFINEFTKLTNQGKSTCQIVMLSSSNHSIDIEAAENNPNVIHYLSKPLTKSSFNKSLKLVCREK